MSDLDVFTTKHGKRVHIRWMTRRHMEEVLAIEDDCFEFPWSEDDYIRCLRRRNCIGMIAEADEQLVGVMIYELHKTRLHILNFAVPSNVQRLGVGRVMVEKLISKLSSHRRTLIRLEVRESNLAAQLFFRDCGFRAVAVLRDYYDDTDEDAYTMQYRFQPSESELALPINRIARLAG